MVNGRTASPTSGGSAANPASATPSTLTIDITIADGQVDPNGEHIKATVGPRVILNVQSYIDEELHAQMGLDSYALTVWRPTDDRKFPAAWPEQFCGGVASSWEDHCDLQCPLGLTRHMTGVGATARSSPLPVELKHYWVRG